MVMVMDMRVHHMRSREDVHIQARWRLVGALPFRAQLESAGKRGRAEAPRRFENGRYFFIQHYQHTGEAVGRS